MCSDVVVAPVEVQRPFRGCGCPGDGGVVVVSTTVELVGPCVKSCQGVGQGEEGHARDYAGRVGSRPI
jgi:hypothetical protein